MSHPHKNNPNTPDNSHFPLPHTPNHPETPAPQITPNPMPEAQPAKNVFPLNPSQYPGLANQDALQNLDPHKSWESQKDVLQTKYPQITDADLNYTGITEPIMRENVRVRLNITIAEANAIFAAL